MARPGVGAPPLHRALHLPPSEMRFKKGVPRAPRNTEAGPERAGRARGCRKLNRDTVRDTRWADLAWARAHAELTSEVVV